MKKVTTLFISILNLFLLLSCTSIPKPSEKNSRMIYGITDFNVNFEKDYKGLDFYHEVKNIGVYLEDGATKRTYLLVSNNRGEIFSTRLPEGTYRLVKVQTSFSHNGQDWNISIKPQNKFAEYNFDIKEGVTDLGKIAVTYSTETQVGEMQWQMDYELVRNLFQQQYPESEWNDKIWKNMDGILVEKVEE